MTIEANSVYTITEVYALLGVNKRKLARLGKKYNIKKVDNRYIFDGAFLIEYFNLGENIEVSQSVLKVSNKLVEEVEAKQYQFDLEVESLKAELKEVKLELKEESLRANQLNKRLRDSDNVISELKDELSTFNVGKNERIEVFTNEEYQILEQRLREWHEQEQKLKHQEQLFKVEKLSLKEMLKHYKSQFKYQKKQSEKILQMHQTLIDTINKQNLNTLQRNFIEAKDKGLDKT